MAENRQQNWKSTTVAAKDLGISRWTLINLRPQLRKGHHWRVKNPHASRLTYQWHVERIEKHLGEVLV